MGLQVPMACVLRDYAFLSTCKGAFADAARELTASGTEMAEGEGEGVMWFAQLRDKRPAALTSPNIGTLEEQYVCVCVCVCVCVLCPCRISIDSVRT
jgi:hypothetical protein